MENHDDIQSKVKARTEEERKRLPDPVKDHGEISLSFIRDCLHANELGDGLLFAAVNRDSFIYEPSSGQWFFWNGVVFERDIAGRAAGAMEEVVKLYSRYFSSLIQRKGETDAR